VTHSLRNRLLLGVTGGMTLLLIIFSIAIYTVISRALVSQFDGSLASTVRMLAASVEVDDEKNEIEFEVNLFPQFQSADNPMYYELWRDDGSVVAKSPALVADDLSFITIPEGSVVLRWFVIRNNLPERSALLTFRPRAADSDENSGRLSARQHLTLAVARDASNLLGDLALLRRLLLFCSVAIIGLAVVVAALVVRHGLRPLNSIATGIAAISVEDLRARLGGGLLPDEILPIRDRLNDLLARLQKSFDRERRFTADVAHELRTPLAGMRSTLEVSLSRNRQIPEYREAITDCLSMTTSMQSMVDNLLTLVRIDADQMTFRRVKIRPAELVNSCWRTFSAAAEGRDISFQNNVSAEVTCESDPDGISMVLNNLFVNAVEYADNGGRIWVSAEQSDNSVEIIVANTGCKLTQQQLGLVFDPFWRCDTSRTDTGVHCGLGLALVESVVKALRGRVVAELQQNGVFSIKIILPASDNGD
jgi:two-component system sensor histidine kinase QseC